jgi:hypothetical protein
MNDDELKKMEKTAVSAISKNLNVADVHLLVEKLNEKDDKLRYNAFLLLQSVSRIFPSVYEYWDELEKKLDSDNSYQRSLGVMLIAENVRWDKEGKFKKSLTKYMRCCNDEKFITARQSIQGLAVILGATDKFNAEIKQGLANLELSQYKENQQKLLKKDISKVLKFVS